MNYWALIAIGVGLLLLLVSKKVLGTKKADRIVGIIALLGGILFMVGAFDGLNFFTTTDQSIVDVGTITVRLHDELANTTTTEGQYNDAEDVLTFYSADASIADGEEYCVNATIKRTNVKEDASLQISCSAPDKELSGVTLKKLVEVTNGKIDLDYTSDDGVDSSSHTTGGNTAYTQLYMSEGTGSQEVQVCFDHEETYHDGMTDLQDYYTVSCDVSGTPFSIVVFANS